MTFERCVLDEAFLGLGTMQAVRFDACRMACPDRAGAAPLKRVV